MRQILFVLSLLLLFSTPSFSAASVSKLDAPNSVEVSKEDINKDWNSLTKKEKRAKKKEMRKELKETIKNIKKGQDTELVLLVILAVLIPPLAMALYDGITNRFWISLLLTLLGILPGIVYTLIVILGEY